MPKKDSASGQELDFEYLLVGEIIRPHGVRGELAMKIFTDFPERLAQHEMLYLGEQRTAYRLLGVRKHRSALLIKLQGISDRNDADRLRKLAVNIDIKNAVPLAEGEHYLFQLWGMQVVTEEGDVLGRIEDVLETGANDVYVVNGTRGEILLPGHSGRGT